MAAKKSKDESAAAAGSGTGDYAFPMPNFDEKAFMRRELESAKITFWTAGAGIVVGLLAWVVGRYAPDWRLGWIVILASMAALGPALKRLNFSEEQTSPKLMFGNWFLLFFTALSVWIVLVNLL